MLKKVKLLFLFLITSFCLLNLNLGLNNATASNVEYLRVLNENAYIYENSNLTTKIFKVPYGYFVKVENVSSNYVRVTYGEDNADYPVIMGYMQVSDLTAVSNPPTKPYSVIKVTTASSDILFNDLNMKKAYFNVPIDTFMYYYGECVTETATLSYVYCNNKLGYIDTSCLNPFIVPDSPDEIILNAPSVDTNETPKDTETNKDTETAVIGENLQIIIIVGISVISVSVVYFLFKPAKQKDEFDDE